MTSTSPSREANVDGTACLKDEVEDVCGVSGDRLKDIHPYGKPFGKPYGLTSIPGVYAGPGVRMVRGDSNRIWLSEEPRREQNKR